eukprot:COSAG05_NODE_6104_length_1022_cov_0.884074_2_plen_242_part_01
MLHPDHTRVCMLAAACWKLHAAAPRRCHGGPRRAGMPSGPPFGGWQRQPGHDEKELAQPKRPVLPPRPSIMHRGLPQPAAGATTARQSAPARRRSSGTPIGLGALLAAARSRSRAVPAVSSPGGASEAAGSPAATLEQQAAFHTGGGLAAISASDRAKQGKRAPTRRRPGGASRHGGGSQPVELPAATVGAAEPAPVMAGDIALTFRRPTLGLQLVSLDSLGRPLPAPHHPCPSRSTPPQPQ